MLPLGRLEPKGETTSQLPRTTTVANSHPDSERPILRRSPLNYHDLSKEQKTMKKSISPLVLTLTSLECVVSALGTGEKFALATGGKSFDRFITIWLENQVRAYPLAFQNILLVGKQTPSLTIYPSFQRAGLCQGHQRLALF